MNNVFKIVLGAGLAVTLASCSSQNTSGNHYPADYPNNGNNRGTVYRANDGVTYRRGEVYRDRNGNVYQNGRIIRVGDVYGRPGILGKNQTVYYPNQNRHHLPPGQAKKIYGGEAKYYAKGQQKKNKKYKKNWDDNQRDGNGKKNKNYKSNKRYNDHDDD